ncbi:MAG: hypothetical protein MRY83_08820 [Flavobacteriales bacterium]|nr:hypothetical protein [Flavobacteriales bacterium]
MMKKILFANIICLLSLGVQAQINQSIENWIGNKDFIFLFEKLDSLKTNNDSIKVTHLHERELIKGITEIVLEVKKEIPIDEHTSKLEIFKLELINSNDKLVYYRVWDLRNSCNKHIYLNYYDAHGMNRIKSEYRRTYNFEIDSTHLFSDTVVYGYPCEQLGTINPERDSLEKSIENNNPELSLTWLKSPNLELQLFGYEGLLRLIENGYKANQSTMEILETITEKKGLIGTTLECLFYRIRFEEVVKIINTRYNKAYKIIAG